MATTIYHIVHNAINVGYLTVESEDTLRELADKSCDLAEIEALTRLQKAILIGQVKRLSQIYSQLCLSR